MIFEKHPNALDLNFEALGDAGITIDQINRSLAREFDADYQKFLEDGGTQEDFLYVYSTVAPEGALSAMTDSIIRSFTTVVPETAGAAGGARLGAKGVALLPLPPQARLVGGVLGLLAGFKGGSEVGEAGVGVLKDYDILETRPVFPSDRPFARGAEVFTDAMTTALLAPYMLPTKSANYGAQFIFEKADQMTGLKGKVVTGTGKVINLLETLPSDVRRQALTKTGRTAEGFSALGSSLMGAALVDEGDVTQLAGETLGGFFEPRALLFRNMTRILRGGKKLTGMGGLEAREAKVGQKFRELIIAHGEDPDALIAQLEENPAQLIQIARDLGADVDDLKLTPAQITGSPILAAFQRQVADKGVLKTVDGQPSIVSQEVMQRAEQGYKALSAISNAFIQSGDQELVQLGVQLQREAISDILSGQMAAAITAQKVAFEKLNKNVNFEVVGRNLRSRFDEVVEDNRNQEDLLWSAIDRSIEVPTTNIIETYDYVRTEFLRDEVAMPADITAFVKRRKLAAGLIPEDVPPAVTNAQNAVRDLSPLDRNTYQKFRKEFISEQGMTAYLRFRNVPQDQIDAIIQAGADPTAADPSNDMILAAADALGRRSGVGASLKADLEAIKRVAAANRKLSIALEDVPEKEDIFDNAVEIQKFRRDMLDAARQAAGSVPPRRIEAKIYGELAQAALRDLDAALGVGENAAYDAARAYSFGFNDAVRRTFVGEATDETRAGGPRIIPELIVPEIFSGNTSSAALRLAQIQNAATFARTKMNELEAEGLVDPTIPAGEAGGRLAKTTLQEADLQQNLDDAVLYVAKNVLDTETMRVDPDKVRKFKEDPGNQRLLDIFPEIEADMTDGARFVNAYRISETRKNNVNKKDGPVTRILSQLSASDDLAGEILAISKGNKPEEGLRVITSRVLKPSKLARLELDKAGIDTDDLKAGLKSAVLDAAWTAAGGTGGKAKYAEMGKILFDPMKKTGRRVFADRPGTAGQKRRLSLIDFMQEEGIFTQAEVDRLKFIVEQGAKFQAAESAGTLSEVLTDDVGMLAEALLSIAGSSAATTLSRAGGLRPQGIVEANVGAKLFKNFFSDQAQSHSLSILEKAILEPDYLIALLRNTGDAESAQAAVRNLNAYLIQAGLRFADDDVSSTEEGDFEPTEPVGPVSMAPAPVAPPPIPTSPAAPPTQVSTVASAQPRPAAQPNVRSQYQKIFPDDLASGIMAALPTRMG